MITVQLVGGPLDGLELTISAPPAGLLSVPVLPEWSAEDVVWDRDRPAEMLRIPVPVTYIYRRDRRLFVSGYMVRYTWTGG